MLMHLIAYLLSAIYGCQSPYPCSPFFAQSIFSDTPAPVASHRGRCVHSGFISKLHQILHLDNGHICDTCVGCPDQCIRYFFFIFDISFLDIFVLNVFPLLDLGDLKFSGYIENADKWFTSSAIREDYIRSVWGNIALFLFDISLIIMGRKSIQHEKNTKNEKALIIVYNLFVIGAIGMQAVMELEIMRRFFRPLYMLWFVLAANILYRYPLQKKLKSKWVIVGNYMCFVWKVYIIYSFSNVYLGFV